jgi:hypothetical protein
MATLFKAHGRGLGKALAEGWCDAWRTSLEVVEV